MDDEAPILARYERLRNHLGIELTDLEHSFMITPQILQDAGELSAQADLAENVAKHAFEVAKAEASERIREALVDSGRSSETRIATMVPLDVDVKRSRRQLELCIEQAQMCTALFRSFDAQSRLLAKAADMVVSGFITPSAIHNQRHAEYRRARLEAAREEQHLTTPFASKIARPV